jgi:hypothetical protein
MRYEDDTIAYIGTQGLTLYFLPIPGLEMPSPLHPRDILPQISVPTYHALAFDEPGPEDILLSRALFGAARWHHCPPPLYMQTLNALT